LAKVSVSKDTLLPIVKGLIPLFLMVLFYMWVNMGAESTAQKRLMDIPRLYIPTSEAKVSIRDELPTRTEEGREKTPLELKSDAAPDLRPAPNPKLIERGLFGTVPVIAPDGSATPWRYYAAPAVSAPPVNGQLSIVMTNMGLNKETFFEALTDLPHEVSLSFSPYAISLQDMVDTARQAGHEVFLDLPMQPLNLKTTDLGPYMLTVDASTKENMERLQWLMSRAQGYVGFTNVLGLKFVQYESLIQPIAEEFSRRGIGLIDYLPNVNSKVRIAAENVNMPLAKAAFVIDETLTPDMIDQKLTQAAQQAREKGQVMVYASPYPLSIQAINAFMKTAKDITLVPASQLMNEGF